MTDTTQNIAIIGAGVMGLCAAQLLNERGHKITLFDPNGFPYEANASFIAGGMLSPYGEIEHMPTDFIEAGCASIDFWHKFVQQSKEPVDFHQNGSILIAHTPDRHILERFAAHLPGEDESIERVPLGGLEPQLADRFSNGIYLAREAHIYPAQAMRALVKMLQQSDIIFKEEAAHPDGLSSTYDLVVDARGYEGRDRDEKLRGLKGEIVIVHNPEFQTARPVRLMHPRYPLYIVPRPDHRFMIGATIIEGAQDARVSLRSAMELMSALYSLHPSFGEAKIEQIIAGIRPAYADNLPRILVRDKVISCNGLFRHGFLLAPVMAEIVANHVAGMQHHFADLFMKAA